MSGTSATACVISNPDTLTTSKMSSFPTWFWVRIRSRVALSTGVRPWVTLWCVPQPVRTRSGTMCNSLLCHNHDNCAGYVGRIPPKKWLRLVHQGGSKESFVWMVQLGKSVLHPVYMQTGGHGHRYIYSIYRIYGSNDPTFKCTDHMKVGSVLCKTFALS
jgi:hypothetical protein